MTSFASLKNNKSNALAGLREKVQASAAGEGGTPKDPRKFKLTWDKKTFIGSAIIRFLPFGNGDRLPWAEWAEFSFKGKGGSYWERSRKTIGEEDPVAVLNKAQWARGQGEDERQVKDRNRRLRYISNIVVISDPAHPENNGQNFLFEYGPAIHKMIISAMVPEYDDQQPVEVYDMWKGATFRLRSKDKGGNVNYDSSAFDAPSCLHADDNIMERFYNGMIDLSEFEAENLYKPYDELDKAMRKTLGGAYCASILGETIQHGGADPDSNNPFSEMQGNQGNQQQGNQGIQFEQRQGQQGQQPQGNADPFANQGQQPPLGDDPFANQQPQGNQGNADPFANQAGGDDPLANQNQTQGGQGQSNADPFASQSSDAKSDDPFADMDMG